MDVSKLEHQVEIQQVIEASRILFFLQTWSISKGFFKTCSVCSQFPSAPPKQISWSRWRFFNWSEQWSGRIPWFRERRKSWRYLLKRKKSCENSSKNIAPRSRWFSRIFLGLWSNPHASYCFSPPSNTIIGFFPQLTGNSSLDILVHLCEVHLFSTKNESYPLHTTCFDEARDRIWLKSFLGWTALSSFLHGDSTRTTWWIARILPFFQYLVQLV